MAFFIWWERGKFSIRVGLGRVYIDQSYRARVSVRVIGLGSDVCQGGGDRIVTLKVVFLHFIWWERGKVRVRVGLRRVHWPEL